VLSNLCVFGIRKVGAGVCSFGLRPNALRELKSCGPSKCCLFQKKVMACSELNDKVITRDGNRNRITLHLFSKKIASTYRIDTHRKIASQN